jgi:hypothetical protein
MLAHVCNTSYLGGRDLDDCGARPARTKRSGGLPLQPITSWVWLHATVIPATQQWQRGGLWSRSAWTEMQDLIRKIVKAKRAPLVELLKYNTMGSNPSIAK